MEQEFDFYITNVKIVVLYKAPLPILVIVEIPWNKVNILVML